MTLDVLVVGDYCLDVIFTGLPSEPVLGREIYADALEVTIGGGTFPAAIALRRLGFDVEIYMQLGNDFFSRFAEEIILDAGFDPDLLEKHDTTFRRLTVALSFPKDRAFISFQDTFAYRPSEGRFGPELILKRKVHHLHIAHLSAGLAAGGLIAEARRQGVTISLDCGWNPTAMADPYVWQLLSQVDIFLPNEAEAMHVTGTKNLEEALGALAERVSLAVIKMGLQGSMAVAGDERYYAPAISVKAVETTAAGDCFNAGFIYGYLEGLPIEKALLCGNICGGLSTTASGWAGAPTKEELEAWLRRLKDERG